MRRFAVVAVTVASLTVSAQVASAAGPRVSGSGQYVNGTQYNGEASGTPTAARGNFFIDFGGERTRINVDCVNVQGNRAALAGLITEGSNAGNRAGALITDNGEGRQDPPDTVYSFITYPFIPGNFVEPDCGAYRFPNGVPISRGNFTVKDR